MAWPGTETWSWYVAPAGTVFEMSQDVTST